MYPNRITLVKRYFYTVLLIIILFLTTVVQSQAKPISVNYNWLKQFYVNGWQAYQDGDWIYALEQLYVYYQLSPSKNDNFDAELSAAIQHCEKQLRNSLSENVTLKSELESCQSASAGGISKHYKGLTQPKPVLRDMPPVW